MQEDIEEGCENESVEQVCFSDKIMLNKIDIATADQLEACEKEIRKYNKQCPIQKVQLNNSDIPFGEILDQKMFSIERALEIDEELLGED